MRHKAFALRETILLLAVAILAGILLLPNLTRTRESEQPSPQARCYSNLRQIALAVMIYSQDHNEKFPPAKNSQAGLNSTTNWAGLLQPYLKSFQVFHCPSEQSNGKDKRSSYGYNQLLGQIPAEKLRHPSFSIALFEVDSTLTPFTQTGSNAKDVTANTRHDDGANYAFADGHVKWLRPASLTATHKYSDEFTFVIK